MIRRVNALRLRPFTERKPVDRAELEIIVAKTGPEYVHQLVKVERAKRV